jgi:hypothetical protein
MREAPSVAVNAAATYRELEEWVVSMLAVQKNQSSKERLAKEAIYKHNWGTGVAAGRRDNTS